MQTNNVKYYDDSQQYCIREILRSMAIGDVVAFPAKRTAVVRVTASTCGFEENRNFATKTNRDERVIKVKRTY